MCRPGEAWCNGVLTTPSPCALVVRTGRHRLLHWDGMHAEALEWLLRYNRWSSRPRGQRCVPGRRRYVHTIGVGATMAILAQGGAVWTPYPADPTPDPVIQAIMAAMASLTVLEPEEEGEDPV